MKKLVLTGTAYGRQILELDRTRFIIGRALGSDLRLDTPSVSRLHAVLSVTDEGIVVSDLDSLNGTYVNGRKIMKSQLLAHDVLRIGEVDIRLYEPPEQSKRPKLSDFGEF